jgi:hypothetical protein
MQLRLNLGNLDTPQDILKLTSTIAEMAESLDILYLEASPNGVISARQGRIALYKNGTTYEQWQNVDGGTVWQRTDMGSTFTLTSLAAGDMLEYDTVTGMFLNKTKAALGLVLTSGDQTIDGIKTFDHFPITPSSYPTTDYQVANKAYADIKSKIVKIGTYTGDGTNPRSITGVGFAPDYVHIAVADGTFNRFRATGMTGSSNFVTTGGTDISSLDADGFSLSGTNINANGVSYIYIAEKTTPTP